MSYGLRLAHYAKCLQMKPTVVCGVLIGWRGASALSVTECKQVSDWLLASPHWAVLKKGKKGNNWPRGFKASRVRWWKGIRRGSFEAPQRRTPVGPGALWVKRESKGMLQRGEIICWIFKIIEVSFWINAEQRLLIIMKSCENKWNEPRHSSGCTWGWTQRAPGLWIPLPKYDLMEKFCFCFCDFRRFNVWLHEVCRSGLRWLKSPFIKKNTSQFVGSKILTMS